MVDIFKKELNINSDASVPKINKEEFIKVVKSRRSVRVYNDEVVPEDVIHSCLDLALLAPNSSNLQAWKFYWVKSKKKEKISRVLFKSACCKNCSRINCLCC